MTKARKVVKASWYIKFNPADFMSSPDVSVMSNEEVGQYIRLLFTQWLLPGCCLPNDPKRLAEWAHTETVSPLVLSKFVEVRQHHNQHAPSTAPTSQLAHVEHTSSTAPKPPQLRNERLYADWLEAEEKSLKAKKSVSCRESKKAEKVLSNDDRTMTERSSTTTTTTTSTTTPTSTSKTTSSSLAADAGPATPSSTLAVGSSAGKPASHSAKAAPYLEGSLATGAAKPSAGPAVNSKRGTQVVVKALLSQFAEMCGKTVAQPSWTYTMQRLLVKHGEDAVSKAIHNVISNSDWFLQRFRSEGDEKPLTNVMTYFASDKVFAQLLELKPMKPKGKPARKSTDDSRWGGSVLSTPIRGEI